MKPADDDMITGINVAPLVDIVLVLLIVLMVAAAYVASQSIPMDLPQGTQPGEAPPTLVISLDADSQLYADGAPIAWDELDDRARAFSRQHADDGRAVISADRERSHGEFVRIVDTLRGAHIERIAIEVAP